MISFKQLNLTTVREIPENVVVLGLLSFLIVWILDIVMMLLLFFQFKIKMAVHAAGKKENIWTTFDTFEIRVYFILMFF